MAVAVPAPASADAIRDQQWHLSFLKAQKLHAITEGHGVTVAVVDTGVDPKHPDLTGNVANGADFAPPAADGDGQLDTDGHGTAMASLIAGHGHGQGWRDGVLGLAPEATILPVRHQAANLRGQGDTSAAITWAVDHGADVINLSFVGAGVEGAVSYALNRDVVVVAGAGNVANGDTTVKAPARYPGVIAVSGTDKEGRFNDVSAKGPEVTVAAPAVDIMAASAGDGDPYSAGGGTSNSTALVSAAAALIRAKYPKLDAPNVIQRLIATADDKGPKGHDDKYGFGVIDPLKALTAKVPEVRGNPLLDRAPVSPTPSHSYTGPPLPGAKGEGEPDSGRIGATLIAVLIAVAVVIVAVGITAVVLIRRGRKPTLP
ncbi:MAG: type VII secretion-associated serine protease mycosin [Micromonosporaceae bacterium]